MNKQSLRDKIENIVYSNMVDDSPQKAHEIEDSEKVDEILKAFSAELGRIEKKTEYQQCRNCKGGHLLEVVRLSVIQQARKELGNADK